MWFNKEKFLKAGTDVTQPSLELDHSQRISSYGRTSTKKKGGRRFVGGDSFEKSRKHDWQHIILDKTRSEEAADDKA